MKKILFTTLLTLVLFNLAFSQSKFSELEKIKKIKIFESSQKEVQKLFAEYIDKDDVDLYSHIIRAESGYLMITFSEGNCGEDEYWNVKKGLVTGVSISNLENLKVTDLVLTSKNSKKKSKIRSFQKRLLITMKTKVS